MKIQESKKFICEICNTVFDTEQKALECEKFGKKFQEWKDNEVLKKYIWYKIKDTDNKEKFIFAYSYHYDYHTGFLSPCIKRTASIFSIYYHSYFNISPSSLLEMLSIEEAYEKYGILPKFGCRSLSSIEDESIKSRIKTVYKKRNSELKKKIHEMSLQEVQDRLYKEYQFIPERFTEKQDYNLIEPNDLFLNDCIIR